MYEIKLLPCVACGAQPCDADHIVIARKRLGHRYCNPRCFDCHRGDNMKHTPIKEEMMLYNETCKAIGIEFILPPMKEFRYWERILGDDYEAITIT